MNYKFTMTAVLVVAATAGVLVNPQGVAAQGLEDDFFTGNFFDDSFFDDSENESGDESSDDSFFGGSLFGEDPFFSDEEESPAENESSNDENGATGCEPGEVHIPEDQNCDGEIDDRFQGNDTESNDTERPEDGTDNETQNETQNDTEDENTTDIEERHVTPAPEPSATGEDWLSYPNPRDHYKHDQDIHREGSIKVCKILLNQNGEPITGTSIPGTTFTIDTNITYEDARPVTFTTELDQVADMMGTSPDVIEGDGYLDAECAEFHDLRLNQTYTYSQENISGEHSDRVETVGYEEYWERGQEQPYTEANSYGENNESDGKIHLTPGDDNRHAEIIVINQITG